MPVTFHLPPYLAGLIGGQAIVLVDSMEPEVGGALKSLLARHPALHDRIFDERNEVRPHINIFVGNECIRFCGGLAAKIQNGTDIFILPALD